MFFSLYLKYLVALVLIAYLTARGLKQSRIILSRRVVVIFVLAVLVLLHSITLSTQSPLSIERSIFACLFLFALSLVPYNISRRASRTAQTWFRNFVIVTIVLNFMVMFAPFGQFYHVGNFRGLFNNANYLGLVFSVFFLPYCFYLTRRDREFGQIGHKLVFALLIATILASRSRAALLAMLVVMSVYIYRQDIKIFKSRAATKALAILPSLGAFFAYDIIANKYNFKSGYLPSGAAGEYLKVISDLPIFSTRAVLFEHRIRGILERPLGGWGYNVNSAEGRMVEPYVFNLLEKGNTPLMLLEEFGLVLGGFFVGLFFYTFFVTFRRWDVHPVAAPVVMGALVHSLFETWILNFNGVIAWGFWLCLFVLLSTKLPRVHNSLEAESRRRRRQAVKSV